MSQFKISRRSALAGGGALLAAGGLGLSPAFGQTRLRFSWWGAAARAERTFQLIEAYQAANPDVMIDGETASWSDYWTRIATQVSGGNAPDLIQMDYRYIFEYARRGALLPLDPYIPGILDIQDFGEANLASGMVDGSLYGVTLGVNTGTMFVKTSVWEEAGVPAPHFGISWDEYAERCASLTKNSPRKNMYGTSDASGVDGLFECWLRQRGKALYDAEGQLAFDAADAEAWFAYWASMRESKGCVPPDLQALNTSYIDIETDMMTLGYAAVAYNGSNLLAGYQSLSKEPLSMNPYPVLDRSDARPGQYFKPSMFMSVAASTAAAEECARFTNFAVKNANALNILSVERGVPASASAREALAGSLNVQEQMMVDYVGSLQDMAGPLPPPPPSGAAEVTITLIRISQEIAFGQTDVARGARTLVDEAKAILQRT